MWMCYNGAGVILDVKMTVQKWNLEAAGPLQNCINVFARLPPAGKTRPNETHLSFFQI